MADLTPEKIYKVFISYSWDSETHKTWVLNLANELVRNGVDVYLDQFDLSLGMEMTYFMEKAVSADKILAILTPNYKLKADKRSGGVGYEYSMITKEYYSNEPDKARIFPILRQGDEQTSSPTFMQTQVYHDMRINEKFDAKLFELVKLISGKPLIKKPELGKLPDFNNEIPDVEKTLRDFKAKEEYHTKKIAILQSHEGGIILNNVMKNIIDQISNSLENFKNNFGVHFWIKRQANESIVFATSNFTFYVGLQGFYQMRSSDAKIKMNFFKGIVGFDELGILQDKTQTIYISEYKFDLNENFDPIFVKSDNPNIRLTPHDVATISIREVVANDVKVRANKLS